MLSLAAALITVGIKAYEINEKRPSNPVISYEEWELRETPEHRARRIAMLRKAILDLKKRGRLVSKGGK
jgi:hypothetical protein